jgi:hypothetical protein
VFSCSPDCFCFCFVLQALRASLAALRELRSRQLGASASAQALPLAAGKNLAPARTLSMSSPSTVRLLPVLDFVAYCSLSLFLRLQLRIGLFPFLPPRHWIRGAAKASAENSGVFVCCCLDVCVIW